VRFERLRDPGAGVMLDESPPPCLAQTRGELGVVDQALDRRGERGGIAGRDQQRLLAVRQDLGDDARAGGDEGAPAARYSNSTRDMPSDSSGA
jgi:hypothetical protein